MESVPKPRHLATRRLKADALCREAASILPFAWASIALNKGVLLLIGRTRDGQGRTWMERASMALDPATDPPTVASPAKFHPGDHGPPGHVVVVGEDWPNTDHPSL
jgi:hypothetical protein